MNAANIGGLQKSIPGTHSNNTNILLFRNRLARINPNDILKVIEICKNINRNLDRGNVIEHLKKNTGEVIENLEKMDTANILFSYNKSSDGIKRLFGIVVQSTPTSYIAFEAKRIVVIATAIVLILACKKFNLNILEINDLQTLLDKPQDLNESKLEEICKKNGDIILEVGKSPKECGHFKEYLKDVTLREIILDRFIFTDHIRVPELKFSKLQIIQGNFEFTDKFFDINSEIIPTGVNVAIKLLSDNHYKDDKATKKARFQPVPGMASVFFEDPRTSTTFSKSDIVMGKILPENISDNDNKPKLAFSDKKWNANSINIHRSQAVKYVTLVADSKKLFALHIDAAEDFIKLKNPMQAAHMLAEAAKFDINNNEVRAKLEAGIKTLIELIKEFKLDDPQQFTKGNNIFENIQLVEDVFITLANYLKQLAIYKLCKHEIIARVFEAAVYQFFYLNDHEKAAGAFSQSKILLKSSADSESLIIIEILSTLGAKPEYDKFCEILFNTIDYTNIKDNEIILMLKALIEERPIKDVLNFLGVVKGKLNENFFNLLYISGANTYWSKGKPKLAQTIFRKVATLTNKIDDKIAVYTVARGFFIDKNVTVSNDMGLIALKLQKENKREYSIETLNRYIANLIQSDQHASVFHVYFELSQPFEEGERFQILQTTIRELLKAGAYVQAEKIISEYTEKTPLYREGLYLEYTKLFFDNNAYGQAAILLTELAKIQQPEEALQTYRQYIDKFFENNAYGQAAILLTELAKIQQPEQTLQTYPRYIDKFFNAEEYKYYSEIILVIIGLPGTTPGVLNESVGKLFVVSKHLAAIDLVRNTVSKVPGKCDLNRLRQYVSDLILCGFEAEAIKMCFAISKLITSQEGQMNMLIEVSEKLKIKNAVDMLITAIGNTMDRTNDGNKDTRIRFNQQNSLKIWLHLKKLAKLNNYIIREHFKYSIED